MFSMKISSKKEKPKPQTFGFNNNHTNKNKKPTQLSNIFGNIDETTDTQQSLSKRQLINREAKIKKNKLKINKIIENDPTVHQYDEVYDSIQQQRSTVLRAKEREKVIRPVRYINVIQKESQKRQIRHDAAHEKMLLKERKETDHLFENNQKYITGAYKQKLKEIEQQRIKDSIQTKREHTISDDPNMHGFFNGYLAQKTKGSNTVRNDRHRKRSVSRSKSRSRSRSRERDGLGALDEVKRYNIEKHKKELSKKTFDEKKQNELSMKAAMQKCEKQTVGNELMSAKERYLKRKAAKNGGK